MSFSIFSLTIKKIFKSYYCWLLVIISTLIFFLINIAMINLFIEKEYDRDFARRYVIRIFYVITLFSVLSIVISNLTNFAIDKQNLIFILSKHYKRISCLCAKILALFLFLLFFISLLILSTFFLNFYGTVEKKDLPNKIWDDEEFFINCCVQIFLCTIYNVLFWSMIVIYFNQRFFRLFSTFSLILCAFVYGFSDMILGRILNKEIKMEYSFFIREIFLHNVFYCPISFFGFTLGICYFHKMDLRI